MLTAHVTYTHGKMTNASIQRIEQENNKLRCAYRALLRKRAIFVCSRSGGG